MFRTRQRLQTAARLAQDAEGGGGIMSPLLDAVVGFHTGEAAFRGARCVEAAKPSGASKNHSSVEPRT